MEIFLPFEEANSYIEERFRQKVALSYNNGREICVTYTGRLLIKNIKIKVHLRVIEVAERAITLAYNGAFGLDMIIGGCLEFLKRQFPELSTGIYPLSDHRIQIRFMEIEKARKVMENISLRDIKVEEDGLCISCGLVVCEKS